jgi:hypothetical protein
MERIKTRYLTTIKPIWEVVRIIRKIILLFALVADRSNPCGGKRLCTMPWKK